MKTSKMLRVGVAMMPVVLTMPAVAVAQTASTATQTAITPDEAPDVSEILVTGRIAFRNRTADPNPVLSYDLEYFQRFEPVSVGEMLKRVPGVTFTSDVLEYDGVQMRGLPPGYTQVLINGRRVPGGEADGSFFVDRIPAELVERIEIVRAPRADQPSEGVAGTLNVVTKEDSNFEGGFAKAGALINEDGKMRPSGALAWAGKLSDSTSMWAGVNYQERRNPKRKQSYRFDDEPSGGDRFQDPEFNNFEYQYDTRDGRDLSGNLELTTRFGDGGRARITGLAVDTDRKEHEISNTYDGGDLEFEDVETQLEDINQQTYALSADADVPLGFAVLGLAGGWSGFREDTDITVVAQDAGGDPETEEDALNIKDDEYSGTVSLLFGKGGTIEVKPGIDLYHKKRNGGQAGDFLEADFTIKEDRYDPYLRVTWKPTPSITIDGGVRYQITRRDVTGVQEGEDDEGNEISTPVGGSYDTETLNPSLHLRFAPTSVDQFRVSVARTARRPEYDWISPILEDETPGDEDFTRGNPELRNEKAWGVDVGYERQLAGRGIFGVNAFYRKVKDLIELVSIEDLGDGNLFTPRNIGDGKVWGVEFDFSTPLTLFGMPDTGIFANYTYLDSSVRDPFTLEKRRFNNQPHHVYNVGFIQTVQKTDSSFGATISGRSKALESNFDETISLRYTPDLEAFFEQRFGKNVVVRVSAQNLLNRVKKEDFRKYDGDSYDEILEARAAGDLDEYEIERERAGRLFQITARAAF